MGVGTFQKQRFRMIHFGRSLLGNLNALKNDRAAVLPRNRKAPQIPKKTIMLKVSSSP